MGTIIGYTPPVNVISAQGVKTPCVARVYKDGQWKQCRIQYYDLHPLISEDLQDQLLTIDNKPLYIAQEYTPSPYKQVEYIEATGTQWIDTEVITTVDTEVDMTFSVSNYNTGTHSLFFDAIPTPGGTTYNYAVTFNTGVTSSHFGEESISGVGPINFNALQRIVKRGNTTTMPGYESYKVTHNATFDSNYSLKLFCASPGCNSRCYECQVYDGDVLVRDFIPVISQDTNEVGLYDKVNNKFYSNKGTGKFIAGPVVES